MKIKPGFVLRDICGEKAIIAEGIENIDFSKLIRLNETAAFLWNQCEGMDDIDEEKLYDALRAEYDIPSREDAMKDINNILSQWKKYGLVE